jgi:hypothetical protein
VVLTLKMGQVNYKFKLYPKEIAKINSILEDNRVTYSFEEIEYYTKALQEIAPIMHQSYERYLKFVESKKGA